MGTVGTGKTLDECGKGAEVEVGACWGWVGVKDQLFNGLHPRGSNRLQYYKGPYVP